MFRRDRQDEHGSDVVLRLMLISPCGWLPLTPMRLQPVHRLLLKPPGLPSEWWIGIAQKWMSVPKLLLKAICLRVRTARRRRKHIRIARKTAQHGNSRFAKRRTVCSNRSGIRVDRTASALRTVGSFNAAQIRQILIIDEPCIHPVWQSLPQLQKGSGGIRRSDGNKGGFQL